jgi:hypothetical protein
MKVGDWFWNAIVEYIIKNRNNMDMNQIAHMVYNLAYLNRKDREFFKLMEE